MARIGRRLPVPSHLRPPAVVGPPVVFRPVKVALTFQHLPVQRVTKRAPHSTLRKPAVQGAPTVFRPVAVRFVGLNLPQQIVTRRGTTYRLQAPTVIDAQPVPFMPDAVSVRTVAVSVQQATGGQRRAATSKLREPTVVSTAVTFGPVEVKTVRQPRRYQHTTTRLQPPTVVDAAATPFVASAVVVHTVAVPASGGPRRVTTSKLREPTVVAAAAASFVADPIRAKLTRRPLNYIQTSSKLRLPTVVDPFVTPSLPLQLATTLVPQPANYRRRTKYVLRKPAYVAAPVVFRPVDVSFTRAVTAMTDYRRHAPRYRLRLPAVVGTAEFTVGFFDSPTPSGGRFPGSPGSGEFDSGSPAATNYGGGSPSAGRYDPPTPGQVRT